MATEQTQSDDKDHVIRSNAPEQVELELTFSAVVSMIKINLSSSALNTVYIILC